MGYSSRGRQGHPGLAFRSVRAARSTLLFRRRAADETGPRRRSSIVGIAASGIILVAAAVAAVLVAETILHGPKPAGTSGAADVAFVTQAATRMLQQHTADVVLSASTTSGGTDTTLQGTGAFDLGGKAGTLNMTVRTQVGAMAFREILLNGRVYLAMTINGQALLPKGKTWIAEPVPSQGSGMTDLTDGNPTAALLSLQKHGTNGHDRCTVSGPDNGLLVLRRALARHGPSGSQHRVLQRFPPAARAEHRPQAARAEKR